MIKDLPAHERPRERLERLGAEALSLPELLAIVLETGTTGKSVLELAQELLCRFGSLNRLLDASISEMTDIVGVGRVKAIKLKAAFAIARLAKSPTYLERPRIKTAQQAFALAEKEIAHKKQETICILLRDVKGRLIHSEKVAVGTLSEVLIHPREIFHPAVRHRAHSVIVAHNHPSGDPTPSIADFELTQILMQSSRIMGIGLDDHLIVVPGHFTSLREEGYIGTKTSTYS